MKDTYVILDHLASVLRLSRYAYQSREDDELWSELERALWDLRSWSSVGANTHLDAIAKLVDGISEEAVARLKPIPAQTYSMIRAVLKDEGVLK